MYGWLSFFYVRRLLRPSCFLGAFIAVVVAAVAIVVVVAELDVRSRTENLNLNSFHTVQQQRVRTALDGLNRNGLYRLQLIFEQHAFIAL